MIKQPTLHKGICHRRPVHPLHRAPDKTDSFHRKHRISAAYSFGDSGPFGLLHISFFQIMFSHFIYTFCVLGPCLLQSTVSPASLASVVYKKIGSLVIIQRNISKVANLEKFSGENNTRVDHYIMKTSKCFL